MSFPQIPGLTILGTNAQGMGTTAAMDNVCGQKMYKTQFGHSRHSIFEDAHLLHILSFGYDRTFDIVEREQSFQNHHHA